MVVAAGVTPITLALQRPRLKLSLTWVGSRSCPGVVLATPGLLVMD